VTTGASMLCATDRRRRIDAVIDCFGEGRARARWPGLPSQGENDWRRRLELGGFTHVGPCLGDVDARLVEELGPDGADGVGWLVERYADPVYRLALRLTGVKEDAEEVVEDVLRTAADTIHAFASSSAFGSWLFRAAAHAAYQRLRQREHDVREIAVDDIVPSHDPDRQHSAPMSDWSKWIDRPALESGLHGILTEAIDALPADYRAALILHDVERMSKLDIAEILDVEVAEVKLRLHHARLFVRKYLSEHFDPRQAEHQRTLVTNRAMNPGKSLCHGRRPDLPSAKTSCA
jgi:RNA polymerase sigma-70 factor (ECF subfamily)